MPEARKRCQDAAGTMWTVSGIHDISDGREVPGLPFFDRADLTT